MKSARKWKTDLKRRKVQNLVVGDHQLRWFSIQKLTKSISRVTAAATKWNNINLLTHRSKIILVHPLNPRIRAGPKTLNIRLINLDLIPITRVLIPKTKFLLSNEQQKLINRRCFQNPSGINKFKCLR